MKHYIGTKLIQADPMSLLEAQKVLGREIKPATKEDDGYLVVYEDGYKSWSPKTVFEKAYRLAETFLDRMEIEHGEVFDKMNKAQNFVKSEDFLKLPLVQQALLSVQIKTQAEYCRLLANRCDAAEGERPGLAGFSFGTAIKFLEAGYPLRRKGWNGKDMFACKQLPQVIIGEPLKGIGSLSKQAKELLMQQELPHISFENQLLIVRSNGTADSWAPSPSDIFANDWEVVSPDEPIVSPDTNC